MTAAVGDSLGHPRILGRWVTKGIPIDNSVASLECVVESNDMHNDHYISDMACLFGYVPVY